jgi:hypothetical protein
VYLLVLPHPPSRYTSDPRGRLTLIANDASAVRTYRFGTKTADFILCGHCGTFLCAVSASSTGTVAVVNLNCLRNMPHLVEPMMISLDNESLDERLERRARRWTPFVRHDVYRVIPAAP